MGTRTACTQAEKTLSIGSLFAGIGGFELGFSQVKRSDGGQAYECKWQVEIDDYANRVLEKHWPSVQKHRDVQECGRHNLEPVSVITAGFPCQDISHAGSREGLSGSRSKLFFEAMRIVRELRPKYIVLENSSALLNRGLEQVLGELAQVGYDAEWHSLSASQFGAPHRRQRLFVIAYSYRSRLQKREGEDAARARQDKWSHIIRSGWWDVEPDVGRVAHGISNRPHRVQVVGNAVVPQIANLIAEHLYEIETSG